MQLGMMRLGRMGATGAASRQARARRDASGQLLNAIAAGMLWRWGGAADLSRSTKTAWDFDGPGVYRPPATAAPFNAED